MKRATNTTLTMKRTKMELTAKVTPFLWFDGQAGEAAEFYTSIFTK